MMVFVLKEIFKDQLCPKRQTNKQTNKLTDTLSESKDFSYKYNCFKVVKLTFNGPCILRDDNLYFT